MAVQFRQMTVEEYLAFDEASEIQHEFTDGELIPIPGGSGPHNSIVARTIGALLAAVGDRNCTVYASQMRVQVDAANYLYPDVSVVCGEPACADDNEVILLNPTVVVEVTSPSSIERDRIRAEVHVLGQTEGRPNPCTGSVLEVARANGRVSVVA